MCVIFLLYSCFTAREVYNLLSSMHTYHKFKQKMFLFFFHQNRWKTFWNMHLWRRGTGGLCLCYNSLFLSKISFPLTRDQSSYPHFKRPQAPILDQRKFMRLFYFPILIRHLISILVTRRRINGSQIIKSIGTLCPIKQSMEIMI